MDVGRLPGVAPLSRRRPSTEVHLAAEGLPGRLPFTAHRWWVIGVASALYLAHVLLFANWLIDDAGISFAYARNLAHGYGLVSQPGLPPVEGYSNPLWVFLLALFFRLGLFHSTLTPKLLSLGLVLGSYALLDRSLRRLSGSGGVLSAGVLLLLSLNTAFCVWTCSGLENPLYVFLLCALFALIVAERSRPEAEGMRFPVLAGLLATALALTRPDAILCSALYPLLTATRRAPWRDGEWRTVRRRAGFYLLTFAVTMGAFEAFRWWYFGQWLPNTYYAKDGLAAGGLFNTLTLQLLGVVKILKLLGAVAQRGSGVLAVALLAGTAFGLARRRLTFLHGATAAFAAVTGLAFLLLPVDWMPGFRFATAVLPFLYAYSLALAASLGKEIVPQRLRRPVARLSLALAFGLSLAIFVGPSVGFASDPTVPFSQVALDFGLKFNRYAERLGVKNGSVLFPDLGGTLYTSQLRVYDLAGLCDRTIGRTLRHHHAAFYTYVFDVVRPTFIHTHQYWTSVAFFENDPRFRRDYVPLVAFVEPQVRSRTGLGLLSGDFVRREVADRAPLVIAQIRSELALRYRREIAETSQPAMPASSEDWTLKAEPPPSRGAAGGVGPD